MVYLPAFLSGSATTDATGAYKIGLLQDGNYTVRTIGGAQVPATIAGLVVAVADFAEEDDVGGLAEGFLEA